MDALIDARNRTHTGRGAGLMLAAAATISLGAIGCSTNPDRPAGRTVGLDAFVLTPGDSAGGDAAAGTTEPAAGEAAVATSRPRTPLGAGSLTPPRMIGPGAAETSAGPEATPVRSNRGRPVAGDTYVIDALVGQINGRPIFSGEFFEPIGDQLRAIPATTQTAFLQAAGPIVREALQRQVDDALYLAEAEAALSPEERQGLRFWLQEIQDVAVARRGGSRAEADRRLRSTENRTLEEEVQLQRDQGLQGKLIREEIMPRIIVSKYEIEREYQRRFDEFNPPPTTRVDRLIIDRDQAELIESVGTRLEAGESIIDLAAELVADGRARLRQLGEFEVRPSELSESEKVSELFREFSAGWQTVGDWTGPMGSGSASWFFVAAVVERDSRPIFDEDVQRTLKADLQNRKFGEELGRYKARLRQDSIVSQEQEMFQMLLEIALRTYGPR
jgi:hypothetical protein